MDKFKQLRKKFEQKREDSLKNKAKSSKEEAKAENAKKPPASACEKTKKDDVKPTARGILGIKKSGPKQEVKTKEPEVTSAKSKPPTYNKDLLTPPKKTIHVTEEKKPKDSSDRKSSVSDEKLHELQETFILFDKNRDGMITKEELGAVLYALGQRPTVMEVQDLIRSVDIDSSGTIDFDEFVKIFSKKLSIDPEQELHEVFDIFDKNSDGFISADELYEMLQKLGEHITKTEAQKMINEADLNRDGKVDYREFKAILNAR